jgi:hypothetical protein
MFVSCLGYSTNLKIEEKYSSETLIVLHRTTEGYIPKDRTVHNLKHLLNVSLYYILYRVFYVFTDFSFIAEATKHLLLGLEP